MNKKFIIFIILIFLIITGGVFWWWQSQPKEPKTYSEIFEQPIDPNLEPEKHKAVYEKTQNVMHFPVKYPQNVPTGFKLISIEAKEGLQIEKDLYYGVSTATYQADGGKKIEILQGLTDLGAIEDLEKIKISEGVEGTFWRWIGDEKTLGLTAFSGRSSADYQYYLIGENVSKSDLVEVAKSLKDL